MGAGIVQRGLAAAVLAVLAPWLAMAPAHAQQFSNAYTRLNLDRCLTVAQPAGVAGTVYRCKGFKNVAEWDVYVREEDRHFFVSFGRDGAGKKAASQTLLPRNSIADDLEWRLERRGGEWHPIAVIARYFTEIEEEDGTIYQGEVLAILRVAPGEACHAAYIDARANANANRLARETADSLVRRFDCAKDEPRVIGERGRGLGPASS